jgi:hypothetical protein
MPIDSAMAAKLGFLSSVPKSRNPVDFCSSSMKAERAVVEDHDLRRQAELRQAEKIAHQHGEAAGARQRDHLAVRVATRDGVREMATPIPSCQKRMCRGRDKERLPPRNRRRDEISVISCRLGQ